MKKIKQAIIVEGKYDKIKVESLFDTVIIQTDGYGIFGDDKKIALIRKLAVNGGIIILTDSDGAGLKIRNYILSQIKTGEVKNAYVPDIYGKEKRKEKHSKEGFLGVEGINGDVIISAVEKAGYSYQTQKDIIITKSQFILDGFSGGEQSKKRRQELIKKLDLPKNLSANKILEILNAVYSSEEYEQLKKEMNKDDFQFKEKEE